MPALICGSFACDSIMVFQDRFKHHILPEQAGARSHRFSQDEFAARFQQVFDYAFT